VNLSIDDIAVELYNRNGIQSQVELEINHRDIIKNPVDIHIEMVF
jgi:hypothetical protein